LSAVDDDARLGGGARLGSDSLEGVEDGHGLVVDAAEHAVLAVEPIALDKAHEELRAVSVGAGVGHGQVTSACVLLDEVLVSELHAVD
jgi:hypothetical protein